MADERGKILKRFNGHGISKRLLTEEFVNHIGDTTKKYYSNASSAKNKNTGGLFTSLVEVRAVQLGTPRLNVFKHSLISRACVGLSANRP